jgi:hypothetical protein
MYPTKQVAVAQMRIQLETMRSIFVRAIQEAAPDPSKDVRLRLYAAQYTIMEGANDICRLAIRTCGGQSMMKHLPLERLYRDSRCGSLMLPGHAGPNAPSATTARPASRSRTTTTCAPAACSASACRRPTAAWAPISRPT